MTNNIAIILTALIGSLSGLLALFLGRRKLLAEVGKLQAEKDSVKADEAEKLTGIAMRLMDELRARLEESEATAQRQDEALQIRIAELERLALEQNEILKELSIKLEKAYETIKSLLKGVALLIHQLREVGGDVTPVFTVPLFEEDADITEIEKVILRGLA
jgi:uncharacterized coiled-coil protein SlyX